MAEDFGREQVLISSLVETLFYVIFITACCIHVSSLKSSEMFYMTEAVKQGFIYSDIGTLNASDDNVEEISFSDISTVSDLWIFVTHNFINTIYFDKYYNKYSRFEEEGTLSVLYENVVLGVPRIRQVRVTNESCEVHSYFKRLFRQCYSSYEIETEDKTPFGLGTEPAWVYSDSNKTGNIEYEGRVATYGGGGYYLDLNLNGTYAQNELENLMENLWITRNTRAIFLSFSAYNTNLNIFAVCKLIFELPPTGGVIPTHKLDCVKLISSRSSWDHFVFIARAVFYIFICFYILQTIRELMYFKWRYFLKFWSYIDCIISALGITTLILSTYISGTVQTHIDTIKKNPDKFGNLEEIAHLQRLHDDLCAITLFFVFIRLFKYLNFNKTMGQLNDTLEKCALDVLGFSLMFFIVFFAYAELGFLLFGSQVKDFRTVGHSMFTLLRTILGDFDYEAIENAHRFLAPIYFLSYIFLVFFVLLNMFLAIINDTYADVKTELAIAPSELQMTDYLKLKFNRLLEKLGLKHSAPGEDKKTDYNYTAEEIRTALEKCGFSYLEIEMFFARYNISPLATTTEYDVDKLISDLEDLAPGNVSGGQEQKKALQMDELLEQRRQLKKIEDTMFELASKIDMLLETLVKLGEDDVIGKIQANE